MKRLVLMSICLFSVVLHVHAKDLLKDYNEPITDHDLYLLKLIHKYHPKFTSTGKITTYYLKHNNGYKDIILQKVIVGEDDEKTLKIIPFSNSISYSFNHGTGYFGGGVFINEGKNITHIKWSCGMDLCTNETYYNGELEKRSNEIISPYYLSDDKKSLFDQLLTNINKKFTLINTAIQSI